MSKRIFTAFASADLLKEARSWALSQDPLSQVLILAPSRGTADDFARSCANRPGGLFGYHRLTPIQLAAEIATAALIERPGSLLSPMGIYALVVRVVYQARQSAQLRYFQPVADLPGFASSLARTLGELRFEAISADRLESMGPAGKDLSMLLEAYERQLEQASLLDQAELYRIAAKVLEDGGSRFAELPLVLLGISPDSHLEQVFLAALSSQSPDVMALLPEGDVDGKKALESMLGISAAVAGKATARPNTKLDRLRTELFSPSARETEDLSDQATLDFFSAPGEARECVEIARRIRMAADGGSRFDQMVLALRSPELYYPLVEDAFRRAGIPGYFTRGTKRPDPAGRAYLALLECAAEGLSASRFAEYLSLGQVPVPDDQGSPQIQTVEWVEPQDQQLSFKTPLSPDTTIHQTEPMQGTEEGPVLEGGLRVPTRWEQLLVDAAVVGGKGRWERRLLGLEAEFKVQLRGLKDDERAAERVHGQLVNLAHLMNFALPLIRFLDDLNRPCKWSLWIEKLEALARLALRDPETVLSVLAELAPMAEVGPVTLEEVKSVLSKRLTLLRSDPPRSRFGRVLVATIEELVARSFDFVFLPGLAEGIFPRRPIEDPLLLDGDRERIGVRSCVRSLRDRERLLLRTAVAAARKRLIVSYPRVDVAQNRSRVPSFYALDILRAAEGRLPDVQELEKRAAESSMTRLGWPAPSDAEAAIDDAEYDLALLDPLLQLPVSETQGRASFLLEVNPHLARSLRTRARKWKNFFSPADGLVHPDQETLALLQAERLRARSYSPTSLQQFAACPYKFYLYSILRLRPREDLAPLEQMDPLTRGGLFHEFQFRLFTVLRDRDMLPVTEVNLEDVSQAAEDVMTEVAGSYKEQLSPAIPRIWDSEIAGLRTDMKGWLREVVAEGNWVPMRFEFAFGLPPGPGRDAESALEEALVLDGIRLRGSVDLVERNAFSGSLRVTDHKTGKAPIEKTLVVKGGEVLQPLLYGLAAEQLLGIPAEEGQLFYCTQRGGFQRLKVPIDSGTCDKFKVVLETIDRSLEAGFLPAAPREKACTYCDYHMVCGPYEEIRIARKLPDELKDLQQLRSLP